MKSVPEQLRGLVEYKEDENKYIFSNVFVNIMKDFLDTHVDVRSDVSDSYDDESHHCGYDAENTIEIINYDKTIESRKMREEHAEKKRLEKIREEEERKSREGEIKDPGPDFNADEDLEKVLRKYLKEKYPKEKTDLVFRFGINIHGYYDKQLTIKCNRTRESVHLANVVSQEIEQFIRDHNAYIYHWYSDEYVKKYNWKVVISLKK